MPIKPINTEDEYRTALIRVDTIIDGIEPKFDVELEWLLNVVSAYEKLVYAIPKPSIAQAIRFRLEQKYGI